MAIRDRFGETASVAALCLAILAGDAAGQHVHNVHLPDVQQYPQFGLQSERLRFEAWGGALFDAYRNDGGNGRPGWIGAARLAYEPGRARSDRGWRLTAELARSEAAEAGTAVLQDSLEVGFRTEWWLATAGLEWDAVAGWMGVTLEGSVGAAWIQREVVAGDPIPPGTPGTSDRAESEPFPAVVVGVSAWRHLTHRVQLRLRLADVVTDPFEAMEHSPAIGLGLRFLFE